MQLLQGEYNRLLDSPPGIPADAITDANRRRDPNKARACRTRAFFAATLSRRFSRNRRGGHAPGGLSGQRGGWLSAHPACSLEWADRCRHDLPVICISDGNFHRVVFFGTLG